MSSFRFRLLLPLLILGLLSARAAAFEDDDDGLPHNLGRELHALVQWHRAQPATADTKTRRRALQTQLSSRRNPARVQTDAAGAVVVSIRLDGTVPAADVKKTLAALGLTITSEHVALRSDGRDGTLSAHLPLEHAAEAARTPGVFSVLVARRPHLRVGKTTSQGVAALHADTVQNTYNGAGITVGVISDSYDKATAEANDPTGQGDPAYAPRTHAADDIANGDLPKAGVNVLEEIGDADLDFATDEGRGMLQIVHDVAPGAALAFATSGDTPEEFADNIRLLRTKGLCDVIVDDISFFDEPFFSDGPVAQAVDEVVTSATLPGGKVIYYSAAGNEGDLSYQADFTALTDAYGRAHPGPVKLDQVPAKLTAGGFHNFKHAALGRGKGIVQKVKVSGADATLNFQWDDPFVAGGVTTDYNLLVFDAAGNFHGSARDSIASGTDDNFATGEPAELAYLPLNDDGSDATYYVVLARAAGGTGAARHLRYIVQDGDTVEGDYLRTAQPTIYGHSAAANADGVAAYDVHDLSTPEGYESFGPVTIYFDAKGNRLATPAVRVQPTIAAVDGVNTSFFPEGPLKGDASVDADGDGFPNFYGTSAAAPHAAGVAALLLQAAGGRGRMSAADMRTLLESTATNHDLDAATSLASFTSADGLFTVSAVAKGDASNNSAFDSKFFTLTFTGPEGSSLHKAIIDIGAQGEKFDTSSDKGYPFTIGLNTGVVTTGLVNRLSAGSGDVSNSRLLVKVPRNNFPSGGTLAFGIDRDDAEAGSGGNDADLLGGATITAKFILADGTGAKAVGKLANKIGAGYSPDVGYGLINAQAALDKLRGK